MVRFRPVPAVTLTGSERYDGYDRIKGVATGRIGAAVRLGAAFTLQASAGQGFKVPSISEAACDFCFAPAVPLHPETARGYDAGLSWNAPEGRLSARATAFELDVRDEITYRNLHYVNLARARSRGTEISIQAALGRGFGWKALTAAAMRST